MNFKFWEFDMSKVFFYSAVFTLGSTHHFKDNTNSEIRKDIPAKFRINITDPAILESTLKRIQFRPLRVKSTRWMVNIEYDKLTSKHVDMLIAYLKKPSRYAILVINCKDYKKRARILKSKFYAKSETVAVLDYEYPSRKYLNEYIKTYLKPKIIKNKEVDFVMDRLVRNYDSYPMYLNLLKSVPDNIITKEVIRTVVDDLSTYGIDRLVAMLVFLDRKTLPIHAVNDLLSENKPSKVLGMLKKCFSYIDEAKYYEMKGLLIANGNINEDKRFIEVDKSKKGLLNLPNRYINKYLILAKNISTYELAYISMILSKFKWIKDNEQGESCVYQAVLSILGRRSITTVKKIVRSTDGKAILDETGKPVVEAHNVKLTIEQKLNLL